VQSQQSLLSAGHWQQCGGDADAGAPRTSGWCEGVRDAGQVRSAAGARQPRPVQQRPWVVATAAPLCC